MKNIRAFIAIDIPNHIKLLLKNDFLIQQNIKNVKWVESENYHINLKFLSTVSITRVEEIKKLLDSFQGRGIINLRANGLLFFPHKHNPKVLSVGFEPNVEFVKLYHSIEKLLNDYNERDFKPHITLGRLHKAPSKNIIQEWLDKYNYNFEIKVRAISLYQSTLTDKGPIYKIIHTVKL